MAPAHSKVAEVELPTGGIRPGPDFSTYGPESIHAPIDYARLLKYAVKVQLQQYDDDWLQQQCGHSHRDEAPPTTLPSSRPGTPSTVYVLPVDDCLAEIAASEIAACSGAGLKRAASDSDMECGDNTSPKKKKQRTRTPAQKKKRSDASKRRRKEGERAHAESGELPRRRPSSAKHGAQPHVEEPAVKPDGHAFRVDRWGYGAINDGSSKSRPWLAVELDAEGVRYIWWDGRTTKVILDSKRRIVAVLLARPLEKPGPDGKTSWDCSMERLADLFERVRLEHQGEWKGDDHNGRRGKFTSFGFGGSFGGGQSTPGDLRNDGWRAEVERELRAHPDLQRLARWGSEGFASFFPKAYAFAAEIMQQLIGRGDVTRNLPGSVYAASTCNLGPRTVCLDHTDHHNYPGIPCVITAFGAYNPDEGGDLFLLNFGLRIRFPPGSTVMLSSAGVRHGNTPVPEGQTRYSFTQYTAGGLVRWASLGFRKARGMADAHRSKIAGAPGSDWKEQLKRLSVYEELPADRAALAAMFQK